MSWPKQGEENAEDREEAGAMEQTQKRENETLENTYGHIEKNGGWVSEDVDELCKWNIIEQQ